MQNIIPVISVVSFISLVIATFNALEKLNNLPYMMQGVGLALVTMLIPLGIVVFTDVHKKRRNQNIGFAELDLRVVTDEVFNFRRLLGYVALIFLPTIFWEISSGLFRLIEIISFGVGISLFGMTLHNIYSWIKDPFELRFSYLRSLKGFKEMKVAWDSVWQTKSKKFIDLNNETKFFEIFSTTINNLLKTTDGTALTLLDDFKKLIDKRSIVSLAGEPFQQILKWHFEMWQKARAPLNNKERPELRQSYSGVSSILNSIIERIEKRALKKSEADLFFSNLRGHSEAHQNEKEYLEHLFAIFYKIFFENIESSPEHDLIWGYHFPQEWKVTKSNLEKNFVSKILLGLFKDWAEKRILRPEGGFDKKLDDVSRNLFQGVEPQLWSEILIFCLSPVHSNSRVKSVIERPWNFTRPMEVMPKASWLSGNDNEPEVIQSDKDRRKYTFELAILLSKCFLPFKDTFSEGNLINYRKELNGLKEEYKNDSKKESKRLELLGIFKEMLNFLQTT